MTKYSYPYAILRIWVGAGLRFYFRRIKVSGKSHCLDKDSTMPVILIANHQNALLDAIVLGVCNKRQINFLARAAVFSKPLHAKILKSLLMQPVYRPIDGVDVRKSNEPIFDACISRLNEAAVIGIFPEGNHDLPKRLRTLKKGAIRMAVGFGKPLCFQAIGIDYLQHMKPFTDLEISIADPIEIQFENSVADERQMLESCRNGLSTAMLDIQDEEMRLLMLNFEKISWSNIPVQFDLHTKKKLLSVFSENQGMTDILKPVLKDYTNILLDNSMSDEDILRFKEKGRGYMLAHAHFSKISYLIYLPLILISKFLEKRILEDYVFTGTFRFLYWFLMIQISWIAGFLLMLKFSTPVFTVIFFGSLFLSTLVLRTRGGNPGPVFISKKDLQRATDLRNAISHNIQS